MYFVLNNESFTLSRIYIVLCFYNAYRIYKDRFLSLPEEYMKLITSLFVSFEQSYDITRLDNISDFIFDQNIMESLKNITSENKELFHRCEDIIDEYLNSDIPASVSYYAKEEIKFLESSKEESENHGPGFLGYGIRTPEFIQKRLSEQLENMSFIFEKDNEKYFSIQSDIDMLPFKIKNMNENCKKSFYSFVNKIDIDKNINPLEKLERILNIADMFYNSASKETDENVRKAK